MVPRVEAGICLGISVHFLPSPGQEEGTRCLVSFSMRVDRDFAQCEAAFHGEWCSLSVQGT